MSRLKVVILDKAETQPQAEIGACELPNILSVPPKKKKKRWLWILVSGLVLLAIVFIVALSGEMEDRFFGTYISVNDAVMRIWFDDTQVTISENNAQPRTCRFSISAKTASGYLLTIKPDDGGSWMYFWFNEDYTTLYEGIAEPGYYEGKPATYMHRGEAVFIREP